MDVGVVNGGGGGDGAGGGTKHGEQPPQAMKVHLTSQPWKWLGHQPKQFSVRGGGGGDGLGGDGATYGRGGGDGMGGGTKHGEQPPQAMKVHLTSQPWKWLGHQPKQFSVRGGGGGGGGDGMGGGTKHGEQPRQAPNVHFTTQV